jgi:hypothetical protein
MNRRLVTAAVLAFSVVFLSIFPQAWAIQVTITVSEDTYVSSSQPAVNQGTRTNLLVYNETNELNITHAYDGWLKFNLSDIPSNATISSAVLRMHTGNSSTGLVRVGVFLCNDTSWNEYTITWNTTPLLSSSEPLVTINVSASNMDYDFNITSAVKGETMMCLVLKVILKAQYDAGQTDFYSRESNYAPKLIIDYALEPPTFDWSLAAAIAAFVIIVPTAVGVYLYRKVKRTPKTSI